LRDDFRALDLRALDLRALDFRAVERLAVLRLLAARFVDERFVDDRFAPPRFAVLRFAVPRFAAPRFAVLRFRPVRFDGTFAPFSRASDRPIAIACLRLVTRPPWPAFPRLSVPLFRRRIALSTDLPAPRPYLRPLDFFAAMSPPRSSFGACRAEMRSCGKDGATTAL
jgi:hypothetical protein